MLRRKVIAKFTYFRLPLCLLDESGQIRSDIRPEVGDIVTFSYSGFSPEGIPTDVKIHNVRTDMTWQDAVGSFYSDVPVQRHPDGIFLFFLFFNF
jgi:hypothetical protein